MSSITLWRIEPARGDPPGVFPPPDMSDWAQEMQALSGHWEAKGCWFTDTPQTLDWYARDMMVHPPIPFRVVTIHVPSDDGRTLQGPARASRPAIFEGLGYGVFRPEKVGADRTPRQSDD